jgi:hypothetical protein
MEFKLRAATNAVMRVTEGGEVIGTSTRGEEVKSPTQAERRLEWATGSC